MPTTVDQERAVLLRLSAAHERRVAAGVLRRAEGREAQAEALDGGAS